MKWIKVELLSIQFSFSFSDETAIHSLFQTTPSTLPQLFKDLTLKCFSNLNELLIF